MKKGLVLEGGAMRGMFTCGVLDVFMKRGIEFDGIIGTSAGAAFGCNYKSRQPGRAIRYNMKYCSDSRFAGLRNLIFTGDLYSRKFAYGKVPFELDKFDFDAYYANPTEFYVSATDIHTGEAVYHLCNDDPHTVIEWMRASASLPMLARPVKLDGRELLDGGVKDSVPLRYFESIGYDRNIVILTQPRDYVKEKMKELGIVSFLLRKYPRLIDAMSQRHILYNETTDYIKKKAEKGELFAVFPPEKLEVERFTRSPDVLKRIYDIGVRTGEEQVDAAEKFLMQ